MAAKHHLRNRTRIALWGIVAVFFLFIILPLLIIFSAIDSHALVVSTAGVTADSANRAKMLARQIRDDIYYPKTRTDSTTLTLSENEINGIIALGMRGIKGFKGRVNVTPFGVKAAFTFELPTNPVGNYLNLSGMIIPSQTGLLVHNVSMGQLKLPGWLAVSITEAVLNRLLSGDKTGTQLIKSIESISVENSNLTFVYRVIPNMKQIFEDTKSDVKKIRDDLALLAPPKTIQFYYQKVCDYHKQVAATNKGRVSLGFYLETIFSIAHQRSIVGQDPVVENKAALLALAILLGTDNFNSLIGAIDKQTLKACQPRRHLTTLANRPDLHLHFIYSAALKIMSDSGISFTIGEYKELLDSQQGGSGFSFADLAADRSGIRLAELALDFSGSLRVQNMAAELVRESVFFPSITALPEGIPQATFEKRGGIESDYYKNFLDLIIERIDNLPLYKSHNKSNRESQP